MDKTKKARQKITTLNYLLNTLKVHFTQLDEETKLNILTGFTNDFNEKISLIEKSLEYYEQALMREYGIK